MRVAVVGAGIMGACAAYELRRAGARVTVFEQFDIDHDRGSSFGDSRIIRRFYDDVFYTRLAAAAYPLWRALEARTGQTLIEPIGGLYFGPSNSSRIASAQAGMRAIGETPLLLEAPELRRRFAAFVFDADEVGLIDAHAGSLRASRCVRSIVAAARSDGADVRTRTSVTRVAKSGAGARAAVEITVDGDRKEQFDRAFICAGPWTNRLLPELRLPVRATRQQYVHLKPVRDERLFRPPAMPLWIDAAADWYGFPEHGDVPGVKLAWHEFGGTVDPDRVERDVDASYVARTREYARRRLPALADGSVTYAKVCLYTVSPDEDFILDAVPGTPGCYFFTGCSGHAFKFASLIGAVATDLVFDRTPRVDVAKLSRSRFEASGAGRDPHSRA